MAAPSEGTATFSLDLGIDEVSLPEAVQPMGEGAALVGSVNTRLNQRGVVTKAPRVTSIDTFDAGAACGGIIPAGHVDSSVAFFRADAGGNLRIAGSDTVALDGALSANPANTYWPAQVTRAGAVPGARSRLFPAVCHLDGLTYFATVREEGTTSYWANVGIYLSVIDSDDRVVVPPTKVVTLAATGPFEWVGLTAHGENGVKLWYNDPFLSDLYGADVSITGLALTVGTPVLVYGPNAVSGEKVCVTSNGDDDYAYLVSLGTVAADVAINKVDVTDFSTTTTLNVGFAADVNAEIRAAHIVISGTGYLAVIVNDDVANETNVALYTTASMALQWTSVAFNDGDEVAVQFYAANGSTYVVGAVTDYVGILSTQDVASTQFRFFDLSTGSASGNVTMHWLRLIGSGASHKVSDTEIYPYFPMQHSWDLAGVSEPEFLFDPSIEVYTVNGTTKLTPIARLGVNTAVRRESSSNQERTAHFSSTSCMVDSKLLVTYLRDNFREGYSQDGYSVRYAEIDLDAGQPRYAVTPEGSTVIAAALPAVWDGAEVTEFSPLHQPRVYAANSGGTGSTLSAGDYQFRALLVWKDSTGEIVRSLPSPAVTITMAGATKAKLWVYAPYSMKNGVRQERATVQVYATLVDGTVFYAQPYEASSIGNDYWVFEAIDTPTAGYTNPLIYSTGSATSPLASECPGAIWDVCCVGSRLWMIDAENRSEVLFTKPKEQGVRFEWNYINTVPFPASAGKLTAIADANGTPLFLTSTGLYQVAGEGPDATGRGQQFSKPYLVGTTNCTDRNSVITTPVGVMFVSGDRFALFQGGQVRTFDVDADNLGGCKGVAHFRDHQEIVWVGSSTSYVYNYARDRWTTWNSFTFDGEPSVAAQIPINGKLLLASTADAEISLMDPDLTSTTAQIVLTTGWIALGGPHDDNVLRDLIIYAKHGGTHGLTIQVEMDYGASATFTKTYSAAEITAGVQSGAYTLPIQFSGHSARAFRLTFTETNAAGAGFQPVSASVVFAKNSGLARKSFVHSLRK